MLDLPYYLAFFIIATMIQLTWYYTQYDVVKAVCVEFTSRRGGYEGQKYYPATYEYEIDGQKYSTYAEALWKPKEGEPCKLFVHKKRRDKIMPYANIMGMLKIAAVSSGVCIILIIYCCVSGYYAMFR
jgi:hypothetical protein